MAMWLLGEVDVELTQDEETGHRDYDITWLVGSDNKWNGPKMALSCPGIPVAGTPWSFGPFGNQNREVDPYAFATLHARVRPRRNKEGPVFYWEVSQRFSTRPQGRYGDPEYTLPYDEEPKIRGGFARFNEEAVYDRFGLPILNSAFERFSGKEVEFDYSRPQVFVQMNVPTLYGPDNNPLLTGALNCVNDLPLWGFPSRSVKLSDASWERLYVQGISYCYVLNLEFDIFTTLFLDSDDELQTVSGFDRTLINWATRVLIKDGDQTKIQDFKPYRNPIDRSHDKVILNNDGTVWQPANADEAKHPPFQYIQKHEEIDFFEFFGGMFPTRL